MDVRFGQLGPPSVFEALDAQGILDHSVPGIDRIDEAMEHPPDAGRARLRGQTIRQAAHTTGRYSCSWEYVIDHETDAYLDMNDPFADRTMWTMPRPFTPTPAIERPRQRRPAPEPAPAAQGPTQHAAEDIRLFSRLLARIRGASQEEPRVSWRDE